MKRTGQQLYSWTFVELGIEQHRNQIFESLKFIKQQASDCVIVLHWPPASFSPLDFSSFFQFLFAIRDKVNLKWWFFFSHCSPFQQMLEILNFKIVRLTAGRSNARLCRPASRTLASTSNNFFAKARNKFRSKSTSSPGGDLESNKPPIDFRPFAVPLRPDPAQAN